MMLAALLDRHCFPVEIVTDRMVAGNGQVNASGAETLFHKMWHFKGHMACRPCALFSESIIGCKGSVHPDVNGSTCGS
jgi:hypothetical protein